MVDLSATFIHRIRRARRQGRPDHHSSGMTQALRRADCREETGEESARLLPEDDRRVRSVAASRIGLIEIDLGNGVCLQSRNQARRPSRQRRPPDVLWGAGFAGPHLGSNREPIADRQATETLAGGGEDAGTPSYASRCSPASSAKRPSHRPHACRRQASTQLHHACPHRDAYGAEHRLAETGAEKARQGLPFRHMEADRRHP